MAYTRGNYTYAVEDTYNPFTMQEIFYPVGLYKEAYDKSQEKYLDTLKKTNAFAYLDQTLPEDSEARQIFDTYINDLRKSAEDFSRNGMSMGNQSALLALQGRYSGEIGRLEKADTAMQEEKKRQLTLNANDPTTIFATNNFNIDDFLDNKTPDQYSVSGTKLYERGMQIGASDSARIWSDPKVQDINKYYQDIYTATGRDPRVLAKWRNALETIPELNDALNSTLKEFGVTDHLKGNDYERAKESVVNGIMNGSVYKRNDSVQRNLGVMTAAEAAADARQREQMQLQRDQFDYAKQKDQREENFLYTHDANGNRTGYNSFLGDNNANVPNGFYRDPSNGQLKRTPKGFSPDPSSPTGLVKDDSNINNNSTSDNSKQKEYDNKLLALKYKDLANNGGFDVTANGDRYHYNYIGAVAPQKGKWVSGAIGDDVPNRWLGFTSSSNVMSPLGNFSAEYVNDSEKNKMRVLSTSEMQNLLINNPELSEEINRRIVAAKVDPNKADVQLVEVPNEHGGARKSYLIAVH